MQTNFETKPKYYILVGDRKTWNVSLEKRLWGFSEKTKGFWNTTNSGDYIAFYVTTPMRRVIGFGKLGEKFVDKSIIWPDEKLNEGVIWKYRIRYSIIHKIDNWRNGIRTPREVILNQGRKQVNKSIFFSLIQQADSRWDTNIYEIIFPDLKKK